MDASDYKATEVPQGCIFSGFNFATASGHRDGIRNVLFLLDISHPVAALANWAQEHRRQISRANNRQSWGKPRFFSGSAGTKIGGIPLANQGGTLVRLMWTSSISIHQ